MSDQPTPETPERDSWPKLWADMWRACSEHGTWTADGTDVLDALHARGRALLAVEDKHPPVFHIRPVWIAHYSRPEQFDRREAAEADVREAGGSEPVAITKEWRWGIHGVNGEPILPESETLKNRVDALEQAHRLADPLGARVLDDEGNEV